MTDRLTHHAEAVWLAVAPGLPGFTVEVLPTVDSTNSELMRRARAGLMEPVLLAAEEQTAGRGRMGKGWHSRAGQSLTFSLAMPLAPSDWSGLSLVVGVSVANSLHPDVRLKWPNDLWLGGRKLGGILVETAGHGQPTGPEAARLVVVGIGINIARPATTVIEALTAPDAPFAPVAPAGLAEVLVGMNAGEVLERVVPQLVRDIQTFESSGFAPFAQAFDERDALKRRTVRLSDGTEGVACGVDASGALQVQTNTGLQTVISSEVSVRPC